MINNSQFVVLPRVYRVISDKLKLLKSQPNPYNELTLLKVKVYSIILGYIDHYPNWTKKPKNAEIRFYHWLQPNIDPLASPKEQEKIRISNERVNKEVLDKIGNTVIEDIFKATSTDRVLSILTDFANRTNLAAYHINKF